MCDLCADAGTLRDGNPCPRCSLSQWVERGNPIVSTRVKRIVWLGPERTIAPADLKTRENHRRSSSS